MTICFLYVSCSSIPGNSEATGISRRGGGVQKEAIFEGWGIDYRGFFFSGDLGNIGELFINNSQFLC